MTGDNLLDDDQLIELISSYQQYLTALAAANLRPQLRPKCGVSDIVQMTLMKAVSRKSSLNSSNPNVVSAWLRTILANTIADLEKRYLADKRDIRREQEIQANIEQSHAGLAAIIPGDQTSPSMVAAKNEVSHHLASALQRLPEELRQVVVLKHLNARTIQEISEQLGKSGPAVASYLRRGLARLRELMQGMEESR